MSWLDIIFVVLTYFVVVFTVRNLLHFVGWHKFERAWTFLFLPLTLVLALGKLAVVLSHRLWVLTDCRRKREVYFREFFGFDPFPISADKETKVGRKLASDLGDYELWAYTWYEKTKLEIGVPAEILAFIYKVLTEIQKKNGRQILVASFCGYQVIELSPPVYPSEENEVGNS